MNRHYLDADAPKLKRADDRLKVAPFIELLVDPILTFPSTQSLVVGLYGVWGYGKSTALSLLEEALWSASLGAARAGSRIPQPRIVRFTPWLYSDVESLLRSFFATLAESIGENIGDPAKLTAWRTALAGMSEFVAPAAKFGLQFMPVVGGAITSSAVDLIEGSLRGTAAVLNSGESTFHKQRESAREALLALANSATPMRVVVLIDDVDRAGPDEMLAMMKLVRLVADLPNISYVMAMDKARVAQAISTALGNANGDEYIDTIVQLPVHLPPFGPDTLSRLAVDGAVELCARATVDSADLRVDWDISATYRLRGFDVWLRTALVTPRDVARVLNAFAFATLGSGGSLNIHPSDLLLLCVLQVKFPSVYAAVRENRRFLLREEWDTDGIGRSASSEGVRESEKRRHARLMAIASANRDLGDESAASIAIEPVSLLRSLQYEKIPTALGILLELFPHSVGAPASDEDISKARRSSRICCAEHFDGYFRFELPANRASTHELDQFFGRLVAQDFSATEAAEMVASVGKLDADYVQSLRVGLFDRVVDLEETMALALFASLAVLAEVADAHFISSSIVDVLGYAAASRVSRASLTERLTALLRVLPPELSAELADTIVRDPRRSLNLDITTRSAIAELGVLCALAALDKRPSLVDRSTRLLLHRYLRLAEATSGSPAAESFVRVRVFVDEYLSNRDADVTAVLALAAHSAAPDSDLLGLSGFASSEVRSTLEAFCGFPDLIRRVSNFVETGRLDQARWPSLAIEFQSMFS